MDISPYQLLALQSHTVVIIIDTANSSTTEQLFSMHLDALCASNIPDKEARQLPTSRSDRRSAKHKHKKVPKSWEHKRRN